MDSRDSDQSEQRPVREGGRIDLRRILEDMQKERIIIPSSRFLDMVREEEAAAEEVRCRLHGEDDDCVGVQPSAVSLDQLVEQTRRPLLLRGLVEAMLEYCKLKLLDENTLHSASSEPESSPSQAALDSNKRRLEQLVAKCAGIYAQLLLVGSPTGKPPPRRPRNSSQVVGIGQKKTPFFEAVYALVSRAVLHGMRTAMEEALAEQKGGAAQFAARVEEELGCLFQSKEFGQGKSRGLGKGGAQFDGFGNGPEGESAQMAAKAEADLNRLIKTTSQLIARLNQDFTQLDVSLTRNPQEQSKQQGADQVEKTAAAPVDNKDAAVNSGTVTHAASVDELIAGFRAGATPRRRRADKSVPMHHVATTRSVMMTSLLPSAHEQKGIVLAKQASARHRKQKHDIAIDLKITEHHIGELPEVVKAEHCGPDLHWHYSAGPCFQWQNSWALARGRKVHDPFKPPGAALPLTLPPVAPPP